MRAQAAKTNKRVATEAQEERAKSRPQMLSVDNLVKQTVQMASHSDRKNKNETVGKSVDSKTESTPSHMEEGLFRH
jgi:hypothetical protein